MHMSINQNALGKRIRERREQDGLSRKALAEAVHISESHLANIERGNNTTSLMVLVDIANTLETTPDVLLMESLILRRNARLRRYEECICGCSDDELEAVVNITMAIKDILKQSVDKIVSTNG